MDNQDYLEHFSPGISPEIEEYVIDEIFYESRYIFTHRLFVDKHLYGYCTNCHRDFLINKSRSKSNKLTDILCSIMEPVEPFTHNSKAHCPYCRSFCTVKSSGMGRKKMVDEAYFVYYEKSLKNPDAIVARGIYAVRDYSRNYRDTKTQYSIKALYVFEKGHGEMYKKDWLFNNDREIEYFYRKCSSVYALFNDQWNAEPPDYYYRTSLWHKIIRVSVSLRSIETAVIDTPFQYSTWESHCFENDMVKFFDLYSRYPCIEYLTKMGFQSLVSQKLSGDSTYRTVNWRGKNPMQVLKLTKQEIKEIKQQDINVTFSFLKLLKEFKKTGVSLSMKEISEIEEARYYSSDHYAEIFKAVLEYASIRQAHNYLKKQVLQKNCSSSTQALITWRDYIADCKKLQMDLTKENVVFPKNLHQAHQNTINQVKFQTNKEIENKIKSILKGLNKKYCFEHEGLFIRPAQGPDELINEGKALSHCVGGYADRYAKGETVLLVVRKVSEPDKPYYTVEIKGKSVIQCRGIRNCAPDQRVKDFMEVFKTEKLQGKKIKTRIKVPA